jgi:hypothetical protein
MLTAVYNSQIDGRFDVAEGQAGRRTELRQERPEVQYVRSNGTFDVVLNKERRISSIDLNHIVDVTAMPASAAER